MAPYIVHPIPVPLRLAYPGSRVANLRILLADDQADVRKRLRAIVAEAGDGLDAVRLAEDFEPDVAVIAVTLTSMNGLEATRRIVFVRRPRAIGVSGPSYESVNAVDWPWLVTA